MISHFTTLFIDLVRRSLLEEPFISSDHLAIQVEIMLKRYSDFSLYDTLR